MKIDVVQDVYFVDIGINMFFISGLLVVFNYVWICGLEKVCFNLMIFFCDKYGVLIINCEVKVCGVGGNNMFFLCGIFLVLNCEIQLMVVFIEFNVCGMVSRFSFLKIN